MRWCFDGRRFLCRRVWVTQSRFLPSRKLLQATLCPRRKDAARRMARTLGALSQHTVLRPNARRDRRAEAED
jgi:hypothetical protein